MSIEGEGQEEGKGERKKMAGAVDGMRKLSGQRWRAKRRLYSHGEDNCDSPSAKKVLTEEDMAHYLEQLQLTVREAGQQQALSGGLLSLRQTLMEGQTSSGHVRKDSPSPRKRSLDYEVAGRMECDDNDDDDDDSVGNYEESGAGLWSSINTGKWKRFRLDGTSLPTPDPSGKQLHYDSFASLHHDTAEIPVFHNAGSLSLVPNSATSPTLVPPCGRTHLSSIPEVIDATREGDEKDEEGEDGADKATPVTGPRVWIAPEVQQLCASQKALLPTAVMDEMKTHGMELVPYVGPGIILCLSQSSKDDESSSGEALNDDKEEDSATMDP